MRKVIMLNRISMDGYFASHDEQSWGMSWFVGDPAVDKAAHELIRADTLLMGRETYTHFEKSWLPLLNDPKAPKELKATAEELTHMKKVVFSKSMQEAKWENSELYHGDLATTVKKLKQGEGAGILILGSGTIVQQLAAA